MSVIKSLHLLFAILLEFAMLFALGYYGFHRPGFIGLHFLLGIGLPALVVVLWWRFAAPRAAYHLSFPYLIAFKLVLFLGTALLLFAVGRHDWAFIFGGLALVDECLEIFYKDK